MSFGQFVNDIVSRWDKMWGIEVIKIINIKLKEKGVEKIEEKMVTE